MNQYRRFPSSAEIYHRPTVREMAAVKKDNIPILLTNKKKKVSLSDIDAAWDQFNKE
jgi:hypothetical protein